MVLPCMCYTISLKDAAACNAKVTIKTGAVCLDGWWQDHPSKRSNKNTPWSPDMEYDVSIVGDMIRVRVWDTGIPDYVESDHSSAGGFTQTHTDTTGEESTSNSAESDEDCASSM